MSIFLMVFSSIFFVFSFFIIGFPVARRFIANTYDSIPNFVYILSFLFGFFLFHILIYLISILFKIGIGVFSIYVFVGLLMSSLYEIFKNNYYLGISSFFRKNLVYLFCAFLLSGMFILYPAVRYDWHMAYSVGNDGARYLMMIEYLQNHYWEYGKLVAYELSYPMGNRPLMHYMMATPVSVMKLTPYMAYSVSSVILSFMTSLLFVALGFLLLKKESKILYFAASLIFGVFGFFQTLYYAGYLGQYFSIVAVFFSILFFAVEKVFYKQLLFLIFSFFLIALTYSTGLVLFASIMLVATLLLSMYSSGDKAYIAKLVGLILIINLLVFFVLDYEYKHAGMVASRNLSFEYEITQALLIFSGLAYKWAHWPSFDYTTRVAMLLPLFLSIAFVLYFSVKKLVLEKEVLPVGMLLGMCIIYIFLIATKNYYLLNKTSIFAMPIIFLLLGVSFVESRKKLYKTVAASIYLYVAFFGLTLFSLTLVSGAQSNFTYIDDDIIGAKKILEDGKSIFTIDDSPERDLLYRQFFRKNTWQPAYSEAVWGEHGYTLAKYPRHYDNYNIDYFLLPKSTIKPFDMMAHNKDKIVYSSKALTVFSHDSAFIDIKTDYDIKVFEGRQIYQIKGDLLTLELVNYYRNTIGLLFESNGQKIKTFIKLPDNNRRQTIKIQLNNGDNIKLVAVGDFI